MGEEFERAGEEFEDVGEEFESAGACAHDVGDCSASLCPRFHWKYVIVDRKRERAADAGPA